MRAPREVAAVCCAALASSCSLVVDELPLRCAQPSDCDALNAAHGLDMAKDCFVYQCRSDGRGCEKRAQDLDGDRAPAAVCEGHVRARTDCDDDPSGGEDRTPGKEERCDGVDNDCDGLVDEGLFGPVTPRRQPMDSRGTIHLAHTYSPRSGVRVAVTDKDGDRRRTAMWALEGARPVRLGPVASDDPRDTNCQEPNGAIHCVFEEVAIGSNAELTLGLGVNASCPYGQLRVGIDRTFAIHREGSSTTAGTRSSAVASPELTFSWNGDALGRDATDAAMRIIEGVDRDPTSVEGCPSTAGMAGASSPTLALLPGADGAAQALAVWRAGSAGTPAPLVGLSVWTRRGLIVDATSGGRGEVLDDGAEPGAGGASVQPWIGAAHRGYFLAHEAGGSIEVAYLPAPGDASQALAPSAKVRVPSEESAARQPALAVRAEEDDEVAAVPRGLAVAWRLGSDERATVHFARLAFDPRPTGDGFTLRETLNLSGAPRRIVEGPVLSYVHSGFTAPEVTPAGETGGWFVAWLEADGGEHRLVGVRVAAHTGQTLEAPFHLFEGALRHLFAYPSADPLTGDLAGYGFVTPQNTDGKGASEALNIGALSCRRP